MDSRLDILLTAGTAMIADVFDTLGRLPPVLDNTLAALIGEPDDRFIGPAYTITGSSERWTTGGDRKKLAAIDEMPPGVVAVWAGNDILGVCCFGDLLAGAMNARGCAGVVVDGGVRDVAELKTLGLPIVARYRTPAQAIGRWKVSDHQVPVAVPGALEDRITVQPGDIIVSDADGVIVVPEALLDNIVPKVEQGMETELEARDEIYEGMPLLEALDKYGHL